MEITVRKKPLVGDARDGLDALKTQLFQEMKTSPGSYRERFRVLARQRALAESQQKSESSEEVHDSAHT